VVASGAQTGTIIGLVGKNSIKGPKDLEGKAIGFPKATGAHYFFARYVKKHGVDVGTLKIKNLQAPEGPAALNRGDVDALFLWEPWMSRIVANVPNMAILARNGDDDVYQMNVYVYFSQKLVDDQELGANTLKAFIEAAEWMKSHVDETAEIMAQVYKTTPAESKAVMGGYKYNIYYPAALKGNFEEAGQFLKDAGVIVSVPDMKEFLRPELMKRAAPMRVQ
jgi:ABC-type nitrate/sulfonate/bicarbonate transport system substrate-binding protein